MRRRGGSGCGGRRVAAARPVRAPGGVAVALALGLAVALAGAGPARARDVGGASRPRPPFVRVASPARTASLAPGLATAPDGAVWLSWVERDGDGHALRIAPLTGGAGGAGPAPGAASPRFGRVRTVARGADWFVNWADRPGLAVGSRGRMLAWWLRRRAGGDYAYDVRLALSSDGGWTWGDPWTPHADGTPTEHGFVSARPDGDGFVVAWLDGRAWHGPDASRETAVRAARVDDAGRLHGQTVVDARTCDCCPTALVQAPDGTMLLAWRDRSADEVRAIALAARRAGRWSEPAAFPDDTWRIAGCPVNGPALARSGPVVAAVWFTMRGDTAPTVWWRRVRSERDVGPPVRLDGGDPLGRVDVVGLGDGSFVASWIERDATGGGVVAVRRVGADGSLGAPLRAVAVSLERASGYPRLAVSGERLLLAWTDAAAGRVRVAAAPLAKLPAADSSPPGSP